VGMANKGKKILCVFAHPDDESFGPGGSIAEWTSEGARVQVVCVTRGEAGINGVGGDLAMVREKELLAAVAILGIEKVEFLDFVDGEIGNNDLSKLEKLITDKMRRFGPDLVVTYDLNGVSGHLDHIAVASATTQAFKKTKIAEKIYYYTLTRERTDLVEEYFVHFPDGKLRREIDLVVDVSSVWEIKVRAMREHKSQIEDVERILDRARKLPKEDYFTVRRIEDFSVQG